MNEGRALKAIRFTVPGGKPDYFDEQGRSLKRFFLASPLKFAAPVSSKFSHARLSPDPAHRPAPPRAWTTGRRPAAPVVAVANGTVVSAGWNGEARPPGPPAPRQRLRDLLHAPVVDRGARRAARRPGRAGRAGGHERHVHRAAPRLPGEEERAVRQPVDGPEAAAARRTDSGGAPGAFQASGTGCWRCSAHRRTTAATAPARRRRIAGRIAVATGDASVLDTPSRLQVSRAVRWPSCRRPPAIVTLCAARCRAARRESF